MNKSEAYFRQLDQQFERRQSERLPNYWDRFGHLQCSYCDGPVQWSHPAEAQRRTFVRRWRGSTQMATETREKEISEMTVEELADAIMTLTPKQAADVAARYAQLKGCSFVTNDGEVIDPNKHKRELELCNAQLKQYVEKNGELHIEGVGTLKLQDRSTATTWDCKSMAENDMPTFTRLLTMGAVTLDTKVATALEQAGQVTGFRGYGHKGSTAALIIDKADA